MESEQRLRRTYLNIIASECGLVITETRTSINTHPGSGVEQLEVTGRFEIVNKEKLKQALKDIQLGRRVRNAVENSFFYDEEEVGRLVIGILQDS